MKSRKNKTDWLGAVEVSLWALVMGFLGYGLSRTMNIFNNLPFDAPYGLWVSYVLICLTFYVIVYPINLIKKNEIQNNKICKEV